MTATVMTGVAGVDASKARLDVSVDGGEVRSFGNGGRRHLGVGAMAGNPAGGPGDGRTRLGLRKNLWFRACAEPVFPVCLAHPNKVRAFAKAGGRRAKTVRLGAQTLSQYGPGVCPRPGIPGGAGTGAGGSAGAAAARPATGGSTGRKSATA